MGREGLLLLAAVARDVGLPLVTEVLDPRDIDIVAQHADLLQIGSRNMQNTPLLREAGASGRPVLLKRGMAASMDEFLSAAEYVLEAGGPGLILCERGVRSFDPSRRNLLDLSIVPALRERTRMPVVVDPSHATGRRALVIPMAKAAVAAGADGIMVEVHSRPQEALSDGAQALLPVDLEELAAALRSLARSEGRRLLAGPCASPAAARPEARQESRAANTADDPV
jgi:3-deoxy-7-phosphoheptulonate synthase